ncbi:hypothetical protein [Cupriavidus necator]
MAQNRNLHGVFDGKQWTIAEEGIGRVASNLGFEKAMTIATSLAVERRVLLYAHEKDGCIAKRIDLSVPIRRDPEPERETQALR